MTTSRPHPSVDCLQFPLLGLDISETKIGIAIVDAPTASPQPLFTYDRVTRARDLAQCAEWVRRFRVEGVVIGLPLNMDGTPGRKAQWMSRFSRELEQLITVPIFLQDERLSTVEANEILTARGLRREEREAQVDAVAAALILEWFLHGG